VHLKRKSTKNIYILIVSTFLSVGISTLWGTGKNDTAYTLDRLLQSITQYNLDMRIAKLEKDIAAAEYSDIRSLSNPEFEYSKGKGTVAGEPGEAGKPGLWGMGLKWSAPNPFHRYFFLKSMRANVSEAKIKEEIDKREIVKEIKFHFYKLLLYTQLERFAEEKIRMLDEVEKIIKVKVEIGESKEIDSLRASVEIQKSKTALFRIQKMSASEKSKLNELFNYELPADFTLIGEFEFKPLDSVENKIRALVDASPRIRLESNRVDKETANLKASRFSIIRSVEFFGERAKEIDGKLWKVGVGISIPLFDQKSALVRQAKLQKLKAETEFEHAKTHFFSEIHQMVAEIRILEKEIETFKSAILKEGRESMELSGKLYKEGEVPLIVFMDAQAGFFEIQERYYEAITEWNILNAELDSLL
jgi:outer membrane protein TolC